MSLPTPSTTYDREILRLGGIPIRVSPWYALAVWLCFARADSFTLGAVAWVAYTVSVLVHELGHATAAQLSRLRPSVLLHGMGGWCAHDRAERANDDLLIIAAGPAFGLALGGIAWGAALGVHRPFWLAVLLDDLAWMGLVWSLVNLLPLLPLDGGSMLVNLLGRRRRAESPERTARRVGIGLGAALAVGAAVQGELLVAALFAQISWSNAVASGWRGPSLAPTSRPVANAGWRRPPPGTLGLAAVLLVAAVGAWTAVAAPLADACALTGAVWQQPWRLVTWPLAPHQGAVVTLGVLAALVWAGHDVERMLGPRVSAALLAAVWAAGALGGVAAIGLGLGPTLGGGVALVMGVLGAWARLAPGEAVGPAGAPLPFGRAVVVATVLLVDLAAGWRADQLVSPVADLAAAGAGALFVHRWWDRLIDRAVGSARDAVQGRSGARPWRASPRPWR